MGVSPWNWVAKRSKPHRGRKIRGSTPLAGIPSTESPRAGARGYFLTPLTRLRDRAKKVGSIDCPESDLTHVQFPMLNSHLKGKMAAPVRAVSVSSSDEN